MANVLFKRGLKANLPAENTSAVVDGSLYFTTDSCQLYLGHGQKLLPIGDNITQVATVNDLPAAGEHRHEFYYVTGSNILAWSDGTAWRQTNTNTTNSSLTAGVDATGAVTIKVTDSAGGEVTDTFSVVAGSDNVAIGTNADGALVITVAEDQNTTYTMGTAADGDNVKINLTPSEGTGSSVILADSDTIDVAREADGSVKFKVKQSALSGVSSVTLATGDGAATNPTTNGFNIDITASNGDHAKDSIDPLITYGGSGDQTVHFVNGTATLSVYTKAEVDEIKSNLEKNLDAMTYRGVASSAATITNLTDIAKGDAWKADGTFQIDGKDVKPGYLIIANGTEGTDGYITSSSLTFDVIAGDVADTTYSVVSATNGIKIHDDTNGQDIGSLVVNGTAGDITVGESGTTEKVLTLDLANVTQADSTGTPITEASGATASITAVTGITVDGKGRVQGVEKTTFTATDTVTHISEVKEEVSVASNVATIKTTVVDDQAGEADASYSIGSTGSLTVSATGSAITMDMVWGSF